MKMRTIVHRQDLFDYFAAFTRSDFDAMREYMHPDCVRKQAQAARALRGRRAGSVAGPGTEPGAEHEQPATEQPGEQPAA
jgi:hypothetical protein